jgi:hypothetical protein
MWPTNVGKRDCLNAWRKPSGLRQNKALLLRIRPYLEVLVPRVAVVANDKKVCSYSETRSNVH